MPSPSSPSSPGCDTHNMVLVHRAFRREFRLLPLEIRAVDSSDRARAAVIAAHGSEMLEILHDHHEGEDLLIWPILRSRGPEVADDLAAQMVEQHALVAQDLERASALCERWVEAPSTPVGEQLASVLDQLCVSLCDHLDLEESRVLPIVGNTLTAEEWEQVAARGMAALRKPRLLVFLGHILEDASEAERAAFMAAVPPPARFLYRLIGRRRFAQETAAQRRDLSA